MSVALSYSTALTVTEVPSNVPFVNTQTALQHNGMNTSASLNAGTTPSVTAFAGFNKALSAGTASIDLTALTGTNGATVNLNGLRVVAIKFKAKGNNTGALTIAKGATNGYTGLGASFSITLPIGGETVFYGVAGAAAVSGTLKVFDLTGTGTDSVDVEIIGGP